MIFQLFKVIPGGIYALCINCFPRDTVSSIYATQEAMADL